MKKLIFFFTLLVSFCCLQAQSDSSYPYFYQPGKAFAVDTSLNADTNNIVLPLTLLDADGGETVTWQIALANVADTSNVTIYVQETLDPAMAEATWVTTSTIASSYQMVNSGTKTYLTAVASKGLRMRLQILYAGDGGAKVRQRIWSTVRKT